MQKRLKKILSNSPLLKVTSLNSVSIVIKMITGFIVTKLSAKFLGPQGIALIGNLRDFQTLITNLASGGLEKAIIKYSAEYRKNEKDLSTFYSTITYSTLLLLVIFSGLSLFFAEEINNYIFQKRDFTYLIQILAIVLPLHVFNAFLTNLLKGFAEFKKVIRIEVASHFLNLGLFLLLFYLFDLEGALLNLILLPVTVLLYALYQARDFLGQFFNFKKLDFSTILLGNLGQYALMALISSICFPFAYLGIRNLIIEQLSESDAGYWDAMNRLANYYMLFILSLLNLYILPKLASAEGANEFRAIVFDFYKKIIPLFTLGLVFVYLLREIVIKIVFSEEFIPATQLFFWQLSGDFFRVLALVLAYQFHAKKMVIHFIVTDVILALALYLFSLLFLPIMSLEGIVFAHFLAYFIYFLLVLFIFRKIIFTKTTHFDGV